MIVILSLFVIGLTVGAFIIGPMISDQALEDWIFFERLHLRTSESSRQHSGSSPSLVQQSPFSALHQGELAPSGTLAADLEASVERYTSGGSRYTRLLRILGKLLLPRPKRFQVSWRGDIFWQNAELRDRSGSGTPPQDQPTKQP